MCSTYVKRGVLLTNHLLTRRQGMRVIPGIWGILVALTVYPKGLDTVSIMMRNVLLPARTHAASSTCLDVVVLVVANRLSYVLCSPHSARTLSASHKIPLTEMSPLRSELNRRGLKQIIAPMRERTIAPHRNRAKLHPQDWWEAEYNKCSVWLLSLRVMYIVQARRDL